MRPLGVWERPPVPLFLLLLHLSLRGTGLIQVKMKDSPIKALMDANVFIPCMILSDITEELDLKLLSVLWMVKPLHGSEQDVYEFIAWSHNPTRPGTYILDSDLLRGNAGLHIPQIQLSDEGEYTCTIFYTPYKVKGRSQLLVAARPSISLSHDSHDGPGRNKVVKCQVGRFYPKEIRVQWVKQTRDHGKVVLEGGIYSDQLISNSDGTFNVTNQLEVQGASAGNVYSCIVSHRSLESDLLLNYTVSDKESERRSNSAALGGGMLVAVVAIIIVWLAVSAHFKKEPLQISPLTGTENLVHKSKATLTCHIYGFSPKPIGITLFLKRKDQDPVKIYSWESDAQTESLVPVSQNLNGEQIAIELEREELVNKGETNLPPKLRPLQVEMNPVKITSKNGNTNCLCTIHITPDIEEDDGAELTVMVTRSALSTPVSASCQLEVRGAPPQLTPIVCPSHISHGETVALTCAITGFKPEFLTLTWLKVDSRGEMTDVETWAPGSTPSKGAKYSHKALLCRHERDCANSIVSTLTIKATWHDDNEARYICRVLHSATESEAEESMQMLVSAPSEGEIQCDFGVHECEHLTELSGLLDVRDITMDRNFPKYGEPLTLSCEVIGCNAQDVTAEWQDGDNTLREKMNTGTHINTRSVSFLLKLTPTAEHCGKEFSCLVKHKDKMQPVKKSLYLMLPNVPPTLSEVMVLERPEMNREASFTIDISGFSPRGLQVEWFCSSKIKESIERLMEGIKTSEPQIGDDGFYSSSSTLKYTPRAEALNTSIRCLVTVNGKHMEKQYRLNLTEKPRLSKIGSPTLIIHGDYLTLTCAITGFRPKPLEITWLKEDRKGERKKLVSWPTDTIRNSKYSHKLQEREQDDFSNSILSILTMKPRVKEDHEATYICRIYHSGTESRAEESMKILVLAVPKLDPIEAPQETLSVGEKIDLSCRIHSFYPEPQRVSWYKEDEELPTNNDPILTDDNGLFYCSSCITYTPCMDDIWKTFRCEVQHQSLEEPESVFWRPKHLICEPSVSDIKCHPEVPECNRPMKLSCIVRDFYPELCLIQWYRGVKIISLAHYTQVTHQDPKSGLFSMTTEMPFTPTNAHHEKQFCVEISHGTKVFRKAFCLELKGLVQIKDVTCNVDVPRYGEPLTLRCEVKQCNPQDFTAEWRESDHPIKRLMKSETQANRDSVSFLLTLTPTAEHYDKLFTCLIKHKDLPEPIEKNITLKLPDVPPTVSEILVSSERIELDKEFCFTINIYGFSPKVLNVKWFKSFIPLATNIDTPEPHIRKDGLYYCSSQLRYTPTETDLNMSLRCEVTANGKRDIRQYELHLGEPTGPITKEGDLE